MNSVFFFGFFCFFCFSAPVGDRPGLCSITELCVFSFSFFFSDISSQSHPHRALLTEPSSHDPPPQLHLGLTLKLKLDLELEFDLELELALELDVELDLELELALECWWRWGLGIGCRGAKLRNKLETLREDSVKDTL